MAIAVISSPAYAGINDASDPVLNIDTQIESITTEVENKINEIVEHTAANKPAYGNVTPSEAPSSKSIPQINDQALQADIPDWNFDGLPYTRSYKTADPDSFDKIFENESDRYVLDADQDNLKDISGSSVYIKHNGYEGTDNPYHGAAIHVSEDKNNAGSFDITSASGDIRVDAVSDKEISNKDGHFYDAVQVYGERDLNLNSAKDIIIYANNNGIDSTDSDGKANNKKGNINLVAAGSTYIHAGINREGDDKNGDGIRSEGNGYINIHSGVSNVITGYDAGVYVHKDTDSQGSISNNDKKYNILITAEGNDINEKGGIANTIVGYNNGLQADSTSSSVRVGVIAQNGDNYIEGLKAYNDTNGYGISTLGSIVDVISESGDNYIGGVIGINANNAGKVNLSAVNNYIFATKKANDENSSAGINIAGGSVNAEAAGSNIIGADSSDSAEFNEGIVMSGGSAQLIADSNNLIRAKENGIHIQGGDDNTIDLQGAFNEVSVDEGNAIATDENTNSKITITSTAENGINSIISYGEDGKGIYTEEKDSSGEIYIQGKGEIGVLNQIYAGGTAIDHSGSQSIEIKDDQGTNVIVGGYNFENDNLKKSESASGIVLNGNGTIHVSGLKNQVFGANNGIELTKNVSSNRPYNIQLESHGSEGNTVVGNNNGIFNQGYKSIASIVAKGGSNYIGGGESGITSTGGTIYVDAHTNNTVYSNKIGISASDTNVTLTADDFNYATSDEYNLIYAGNADKNSGTGIDVSSSGQVTLNSSYNEVYGGQTGIKLASGTVNMEASKDNTIFANDFGIHLEEGSSKVVLSGASNYIRTFGKDASSADGINIADNAQGSVALTATSGNNVILSEAKKNSADSEEIGGDGILTQNGSNADVTLTSEQGNNIIAAGNNGIDHRGSQNISLIAQKGINAVYGSAYYDEAAAYKTGDGIRVDGSGTVSLKAKYNYVSGHDTGIYLTDKASSETNKYNVSLIAESNYIGGETSGFSAKGDSAAYIEATNGYNHVKGLNGYGIESANSAAIDVIAKGSNLINGSASGISASDSSNVILKATDSNIIQTADKGYAIKANASSNVSLGADAYNYLSGAVYASGDNVSVNLIGNQSGASNTNYIDSKTVIENAGDLASSNVVSALYAEDGSSINLNGESNILRTHADPYSSALERVVWAYNGNEKGTAININGFTSIATDSYAISSNSQDIAIAAGTATNLSKDAVSTSKNMSTEDRAKVILSYDDFKDASGNSIKSSISGDILAAYEGYVDISPTTSSSNTPGINITGNLLAGNNGILNVNLGCGGTLTGRADDYGDAGVISENGHSSSTFFNPAFSSEIYKGGAINLTMGQGSVWNVTGQSWITSITTNGGIIALDEADLDDDQDSLSFDVNGLPIINLVQANSDLNTAANALTVYKFNGDAVFSMNLDGNNLNNSNMLYIKEANGTYYINLVDAVSEAEINNGHDGLRFATIGAGSDVTFHVGSMDKGIFNVTYGITTDEYDNNDENDLYNGDSLTEQKPGSDTVDGLFGSEGAPVGEDQQETDDEVDAIMTLSDEADPQAAAGSADDTGAINYKLYTINNREVSDIGKTVIDMSRANYANAIYMDTLNKRLGEARFVGNTDHGVWVRLRHDNIGKEDSFRSHNTMVEIGFDQRDLLDSGEFHTGLAIDYMNGDLDYRTVDGDGNIERYGLWFYTTYLADDGQYLDLVLKYGHLKNDFGFNTRTWNEYVSGEYSNDLASISAEYGWKFSNSSNYYIEPQAQLQYTYVAGANYTTSQGSEIELDSINSLIGRAGFRAGKDFLDWEHPVTMYVRADVMHEFLGDQKIRAYDNSGYMDVTYENDDTWYTLGLGMSVKSSENSYFFIEGETALGADNSDTYILSGGFKYSF